MRERLVELIKARIDNKTWCVSDLADYLITNGVVVMPCKVGDMVYVIEPCTCYNNYSDFEQCHHKRTKATKWIEMVRVPKKHFTKCLKLYERPFKVEYITKIGKTVFLNREDAERALKGDAKE